MSDLLLARRKMCHRLAEHIAIQWPSVDVDDCRELIDAMLPSSYDETEAQMAAIDRILGKPEADQV